MANKDFSGIKNNSPLPDPSDIKVPNDAGDLLGDYIESTTSLLNELERSALAYESGRNRQENAATIRRILHKIKGESSMVGIDDMNELSHQTEDAFEEIAENKRVDMLLRFKDWACAAMQKLSSWSCKEKSL
jgi:chemotaxis protein histidine kinase CheA